MLSRENQDKILLDVYRGVLFKMWKMYGFTCMPGPLTPAQMVNDIATATGNAGLREAADFTRAISTLVNEEIVP